MIDATEAWMQRLRGALNGNEVKPRGKLTREVLHATYQLDMHYPVVLVPERKLSYKFLGGEAHWILSGDGSVAGIAPFNKNISQFSDDGSSFFGAYGPKFVDQLPYVVKALTADPDTRQAGLTLWRENPGPTKDVPCTVAVFFNIRASRDASAHVFLNAHVFMRSNDVWLGMPYDMFNFSMMAHLVAARLNKEHERIKRSYIEPGSLFVTAMSSHIYEEHFAAADAIVGQAHSLKPRRQLPVPAEMWLDEQALFQRLDDLRHELLDSKWWLP